MIKRLTGADEQAEGHGSRGCVGSDHAVGSF